MFERVDLAVPTASGVKARPLRFAWIPIPLFAIAIAAVWFWGAPRAIEPPYLVAILNFILRTATSVFVAYLAARSFGRNGSLSVLLLGCGMLTVGVSSLVSGLAVHFQQVNLAVTVFNTGMAFAGVCHVLMVLIVFGRDNRVVRHARMVVTTAYTLVVLIVAALSYAAAVEATPLFIDPVTGPTPLRQTVLGTAVGMFAFAAVVVGSISRQRTWTFGRWYAMAMALFALGLFAVLIAPVIGGLVGWLGRSATYLGAIYMLVGVWLASSKNGEWDAVLHAALRESEGNFRALADATSEGIAISEDGVIRDANERLANMLGCDLDELIGRSLTDFIPPDQVDRIVQAMRSTHQATFEHEIIRKDGKRISVETHSQTRILNKQTRWFAAIRDISDRKQQEQALRKSHDELERRVAERTAELKQRADQLAHLTSELTMTEQRERRRLAQVLHDHLQQLLVGAKYGLGSIGKHLAPEPQRALDEVDRLLDESVKVSRSLAVELSPPILHEAGLAAGLDWLARWMQETHGLTVNLKVEGHIAVDREDVRLMIFQAVRELLFNVAKHADVSQAKVTVSQHDDQQLQVTVEDHGSGFDSASMFNSVGRVAGGFGLFSIRERLELLGGTFKMQSKPGQGTHITLTAQLKGEGEGPPSSGLAHAVRAAPRQPSPPAAAEPARPDRQPGPIRLMLADDHAVMRQGLSAMLAGESAIEVVGEAANGEEAVKMARRLRPDVILMDYSMPILNGVQATRAIIAERPDTCIIGLSMYEEPETAAAMLDAGAVAYTTKAGHRDALVEMIRTVAGATKPSASQAHPSGPPTR
ncbi:response regulator [Phycisphaerales bacterium AB-hyl4]|uniref:Response regulator n=1 Tax=Natronomicrosphaera hydrolytica TaxID=3242702 RepID=A0ABV4U1F7_9BACT